MTKPKQTDAERLERTVTELTEQIGVLVQAIDELRTEVQWMANNRETSDEVKTN